MTKQEYHKRMNRKAAMAFLDNVLTAVVVFVVMAVLSIQW